MLTQEYRELLHKDLSGRVPYETIVNVKDYGDFKLASVNWWEEVGVDDGTLTLYELSTVKPYLRPLRTMTDEEKEEFRHMGGIIGYDPVNDIYAISAFSPEAYDWLNKKGFDYRELIEKGLAIEMTKDMYK